ncbi:MAG TPA: peptidase M61 [Cyanobacteria bacterium UBA11149]|nr:peptidase M61 [Cyanobacteria bacterium UBA11367]HBE56717.1 peptidase M61 [Cyanobacteria bacterium UBA11366]HBR72205.1 peptidase M61 [Cyanobacteria bacterium UBA11159]HBS70403.1 peptidase M61 [Cyanobacteria bacterium UBA11153]HBW91237.1 peptidase M61 [Cyanobacteria bacterium UBA11149]HCA95898.1 peptidase M61 [Cyanobacteria bacterium UBA9226]
MTEATTILPSNPSTMAPTIHYQVAMPKPQSHLFEVRLQVINWSKSVLDLKMPVWTPGSYLIREYAKHLQDFWVDTGKDNGHQLLSWQKVSKNHWQVDTEGAAEIIVHYRIFANELSVRTNHLDLTHGYFNGAALFLFIPGWEQQPIQVTIVPPNLEWKVVTPLPAIPGTINTFEAKNFDTLVDSPFEIGYHQLHEFEVLGKPHQLAIWGKGNANPNKMIEDLKKIIEVEAQLYGGLPYERYVFLLHLSSSGFGGLEHKNSCSLNYSRFGFRAKDKYNRFIQLVAHEFFHLWNVKRILPKPLEKFNYEEENYTTSLWFCEGTTSYYDLIIPLRAGIYDSKTFLECLSKDITRLQTTPGRLIQNLSESSFDTWIKLYRRDSNSDNSQVSYYLKGELVSLLLDLLIRKCHHNQRSLDDVMRLMWQKFGAWEIGFTPQNLRDAIESVADMDLGYFFDNYVDGTIELPFDEYLEPFGLKLIGVHDEDAPPYLGAIAKSEHGQEIVKFVEANSPARIAGIDPGDQLLAINGWRVTAEQLCDRLKDYQVNDTIEITLFHEDELRTLPVTLGKSPPTRYQILPIDNPTDEQKHNLTGWLG